MSAGCVGSPFRPVEKGWHGGDAARKNGLQSLSAPSHTRSSRASPCVKCSSPNLAQNSGCADRSIPCETAPARRTPSSVPPAPQKPLSTAGVLSVSRASTRT